MEDAAACVDVDPRRASVVRGLDRVGEADLGAGANLILAVDFASVDGDGDGLAREAFLQSDVQQRHGYPP